MAPTDRKVTRHNRTFDRAAFVLGFLLFAVACYLSDLRLVAETPEDPSPTPDATPTPSEPPTPTPIPFPTLSALELLEAFPLSKEIKGLSGRIAFSATVGEYTRLYTLDLDTGRVRPLIDGPGNNSYPSWSPDGAKVVFTSDRDGNNEIYIADWDGSNQTRLTKNRVADDNASFSPDGRAVVYYQQTGKKSNQTDIFVRFLEKKRPLRVTNFSGKNSVPRWSPTGNEIAFTTNRFWPGWDVCLWDLGTKKERCILTGSKTYCRASWSNSGKYLAYSYGIFKDVDLGVYDVRTTQRSDPLEDWDGREYDVVWSPDDSGLAFVAERNTPDNFNMYYLNRKTRKAVPLIESPHNIRYLSWSAARTFDLESKRMREEHRRISDLAKTPSPAPVEEATPAASPEPKEGE